MVQYDLDEKTILIHDLWIARQTIEDARYRADVLALRDKRYKTQSYDLKDIWDILDDMRCDLIDGREHETDRQEACGCDTGSDGRGVHDTEPDQSDKGEI